MGLVNSAYQLNTSLSPQSPIIWTLTSTDLGQTPASSDQTSYDGGVADFLDQDNEHNIVQIFKDRPVCCDEVLQSLIKGVDDSIQTLMLSTIMTRVGLKPNSSDQRNKSGIPFEVRLKNSIKYQTMFVRPAIYFKFRASNFMYSQAQWCWGGSRIQTRSFDLLRALLLAIHLLQIGPWLIWIIISTS